MTTLGMRLWRSSKLLQASSVVASLHLLISSLAMSQTL